ncbi:MAG: fatty acid desaturase [Bdellovibrionales bacterium]
MAHNTTEKPEIDWPITLFLIITPIVALVMTPILLVFNGLSWPLIGLLVVYGGLSNMSITAGYHRLLAHQSYTASLWLKLAYLFVGAGAFQGSAVKWCSDHRRHHRFVDTEEDPYNINRGFFFAHMGWLFWKYPLSKRDQFAPDLVRDKWIWFQHRYYVPLAIISGFVVPTLVGWMMGSPLGGFIFGGALRIVITQQTTFLINSYCHYFGKQTYGKANSAKDSVIVSFFTHGEGYHNFHHHFQADYRNGVRWYDWDPTKWLIRTMAFIGAARGLRRVPAEKILQAQMAEQERSLLERGVSREWVLKLKIQVEESQRRWSELKMEMVQTREKLKRDSQERMDELRARYESLRREIKIAKRDFKSAREQWHIAFRQLAYT